MFQIFNLISKAIEEILPENEEKDAIPHITIGRVRSDKNIYKLKEIISKERESFYGETLIGTIKLKSSTLTPEGSKYTDIAVFALKKP